MKTATVTYSVGEPVGYVHTINGVMLNLTIEEIHDSNMVTVRESVDLHNPGDGLLSKTWKTPVELLFKRPATKRGIDYQQVRSLVTQLAGQIENRASSDEFRDSMVATHNALCALAKFL